VQGKLDPVVYLLYVQLTAFVERVDAEVLATISAKGSTTTSGFSPASFRYSQGAFFARVPVPVIVT
jgi:hypothetical protein